MENLIIFISELKFSLVDNTQLIIHIILSIVCIYCLIFFKPEAGSLVDNESRFFRSLLSGLLLVFSALSFRELCDTFELYVSIHLLGYVIDFQYLIANIVYYSGLIILVICILYTVFVKKTYRL